MDTLYRDEVKNARSVSVRTAKWYRVYADKCTDDESTIWAVDEGTSETERFCFKVIMASAKPIATDTFLSANPNSEVKAWITVFGVLREQTDSKGRTVITITRK